MRYDAVQNFINEVRDYDGFIPANDPGGHQASGSSEVVAGK